MDKKYSMRHKTKIAYYSVITKSLYFFVFINGNDYLCSINKKPGFITSI